LEACNCKEGEPVPAQWSLEKQADGDRGVGLGGNEMVADIVDEWWIWKVVVGGRLELLVWWIGGVVGWKFEEGFKVGRCVCYEEVNGCCTIFQNLQKETHLHENKHDGRHKYVETLNQDNDNQD